MTLRTRIATLAIALAMLVATPRAMAAEGLYEPKQDVVKLKDGRELKGTIACDGALFQVVWKDDRGAAAPEAGFDIRANGNQP